MTEGEFWNNLGSFVDKKSTKPVSLMPHISKDGDKVGSWLKTIPKQTTNKTALKAQKPLGIHSGATALKVKEGEKNITQKVKGKAQSDVVARRSRKCLLDENADSVKKLYVPRLFFNKKTKFKTKNKKTTPLFFGPIVECNFNLPRVSQQLERLMGSSVVRLTDRKYMLDLQKKIQDDYHDTLMKRISNRQLKEEERQLTLMLNPRPDVQKFSKVLFAAQSIVLASELERERRMGNVGSEKYPKIIAENPVFVINNKSNALLMNKRNKLKTVRAKNAEELIKQGKRWEREKIMMAEQERVNEIETRKKREKMLEQHTLYIFDPVKADLGAMDFMKIKSKKFTDCEIDLKKFLLSERENNKIKRLEEQRELMRVHESKKASHTLTIATPTALRSQDVASFDEKQEGVGEGERNESGGGLRILENEAKLQISAEEMRRKQAKKDEDPKIAKFKATENVKTMYELAEQIISNDVIKGAQ